MNAGELPMAPRFTRHFCSAFAFLLSISNLIVADFISPDPSKSDLQQYYYVGQKVNISWASGWQGVASLGSQPGRVDLWITYFKITDVNDDYKKLLISNVTMNENGRLDWTVDISADRVGSDGRSFVYRFVNHTDDQVYPSKTPMLASKGFMLLPRASVADTSASASATPSASTAASSITTSGAASATATAAVSTHADPKAKSSDTAAIAGGIVGGLAGVALLLGLILLILRQRRKRSVAKDNVYGDGSPHTAEPTAEKSVYAHEVFVEPPELAVPGHVKRLPMELDGREVAAESPRPSK